MIRNIQNLTFCVKLQSVLIQFSATFQMPKCDLDFQPGTRSFRDHVVDQLDCNPLHAERVDQHCPMRLAFGLPLMQRLLAGSARTDRLG